MRAVIIKDSHLFLMHHLGGGHAIRFNLFASEQAKRISTTIVAAIHLHHKIIPTRGVAMGTYFYGTE